MCPSTLHPSALLRTAVRQPNSRAACQRSYASALRCGKYMLRCAFAGVDLKLVVVRCHCPRFEKQFEHITQPKPSVVGVFHRYDRIVFKVRKEVQIHVIPLAIAPAFDRFASSRRRSSRSKSRRSRMLVATLLPRPVRRLQCSPACRRGDTAPPARASNRGDPSSCQPRRPYQQQPPGSYQRTPPHGASTSPLGSIRTRRSSRAQPDTQPE